MCGTIDYGIYYQGRPGADIVIDVHGFVDAAWAVDIYRRRSTSWYVFNLFGGDISWMGKRHDVVSLSTIEAEYMSATHARKEPVWLQRLCSSIMFVQNTIRLYCDKQSAVFLDKNLDYHVEIKRIDH